jgi:hypothetical protein
MKCFYCGQPLDFLSLHIDHVLPKSLANDPAKLEATLTEYEIIENYPGFSLGALSNMVPCHGASCNLRKSNIVLPKKATLFYLSLTHEKLPKVLTELERLSTIAERGVILGRVGTLLERRQVADTEVADLVAEWEFRSTLDEPLVVTFGLDFAQTMQIRGLQSTKEPAYAVACDQFEAELVQAIRSATHYAFHYAEASARNGETLSVRFVFPALALTDAHSLPLSNIAGGMPWWELLEVTNFYQAYGCRYGETIDGPELQEDQHEG